jgi:pre-mRNA-splicing factor CWC22
MDGSESRRASKRPREHTNGANAAASIGTGANTNAGADAGLGKPATRSDLPKRGGVYIPPFRLKRMIQDAKEDKGSEQYQRMMWEALRKSVNGVVNKVLLPSYHCWHCELSKTISAHVRD